MQNEIIIGCVSEDRATPSDWWRKILFVAFPLVVTSNGPRGFMICVYYMTGPPEGSPKVVLWRSWESNLRPLVYKTGGEKKTLCGFPGLRYELVL